MIMVILNYSFHYENDTDKTVGPPVLFWAFYSWIPIWGPVLSLLYLSRSQFGRRKLKTRAKVAEQAENPLRSPLIGETTEDSDRLLTDSENGNSPSRSALAQSHSFTRDLTGHFSDEQGVTPDQSRSYEKYYGDLVFANNNNSSNNTNSNNVSGEYDSSRLRTRDLAEGEESFTASTFLYRDTTATNALPSDLHFANVLRGAHPPYLQDHDFSYRGEEEHNGQFQ